ncbi:uncharacterized protein LOC125210574 [Salvia hispanica]|uniref:uncharacterized protein LOC125210574 n=1 Tax=Salvia hispanica TaxID=49212 RepID=UPI00200926DE|nr:uncharacterized protein LOC125210574 [Salvia hispanica]
MYDLWNEAWDYLIQEVQREADEEDEAAAVAAVAAIPREIRHRRTIPRDHVGAAERFMADYFSADPRYPAEIFRRRFRMSRPLFTHIATTLADRQLAYAGPADMFDEYLQMGETTSLNVLRQFCKGIREVFGPEFLRKPTPDECQRLLDMHGAVHSFPGMMGSIDCMHWEWKNCPVAWKDQFTTGLNNDINVLQSLPIFNDECLGRGSRDQFCSKWQEGFANSLDFGTYKMNAVTPAHEQNEDDFLESLLASFQEDHILKGSISTL